MDSDRTVTLDATPCNASAANSSFYNESNEKTEDGNHQREEPRLPFSLHDMYYDMKGKKIIVIFNHFTYEKNAYHPKPELLQRDGTLEDGALLERTFVRLGFKPHVFLDKRFKEILKELATVVNMDHTATSCIVVAIMTHGRNGGILLAHDIPYHLREITKLLHHPSLNGKPKLMFIQACRSGHVENDRPILSIDNGQNINQLKQDDMLIMYSSSPHFYSFRFPGYGTWMVRFLCTYLLEHHVNFDLLQILTFVNQAVANSKCLAPETTDLYVKQMPEIDHKLKKLLKL